MLDKENVPEAWTRPRTANLEAQYAAPDATAKVSEKVS